MLANEFPSRQIEDLFAFDRPIKVPVEIVQRLLIAETGCARPTSHHAFVTDRQFVGEEEFQKLGIVEVIGCSLLESNVQRGGQAAESQLLEHIREFCVHAIAPFGIGVVNRASSRSRDG